MNPNDNEGKNPGEAEGDGRAQHGFRNEVSWDDGKGFQPYTNQDEEHGPAAAHEYQGGDAGEVARRNVEQLEAVKRKEEPPVRESRRET
ncbi:MAG TPA: hypothetical protein VHL79_00270 [Ramlibacter sp.]|jgi:hypothetical protein|nr:hypothetical protein [Ramlibacter sp.]